MEENLYVGEITPYESETEKVVLCSAEDFESECEFIACTVKRLIRTEGIRCRDIAVISRSENNYSRKLRSALIKNGVPVFEDKRQPISSEPLIEFVRSAIEIGTSGFSTDALMRLAKTELTDLGIEEISKLENYALMWQINGKKWLDEWTAHPNGLGEKMLEENERELKEINGIRLRLVSPLQKFRVKMKEFTSFEAAQAIYFLLVDMNVADNLKKLAIKLNERSQPERAAEQDRIWSLLMEMLDRIAVSLEGVRLTPSRFRDLFDLLVSTYSVGTLPQGLDEITIGSADRVKTTAPKVVFAVGMNDGIFPMIPNSDGIFSENDRRELAELELKTDDSNEEKMMEERFIAYNTLCSTSDRLYVTYSRKDINGGQASPSEIVSQLKKIFPKLSVVDTVCLDDLYRIEGRESAFDVMARLTRQGGKLFSTLEGYFEAQPEYSGRLAALRRGINKEEMKIKDRETATKLFGLNMYMSASRTEVYHKCPFEYFCKYGLNAKPRKTAELDPMQKGTAIHYILEKLISAYGSDGLVAMNKPDRDKCVLDILDEYFSENLTAGEEMGERFDYLFRQLGLIVCEVVDRLVAEFTYSDFVPAAFELSIDTDGEVGTYDIPLPDGGMLKLKGSVDRVDVAQQNGTAYIRVIDYKSSGKKFDLSEVFSGLNMQMLIYLFA
ncbi:MAG: PD-(D/E)XK nuclease family protein, partial [Huintestinicola sp.]